MSKPKLEKLEGPYQAFKEAKECHAAQLQEAIKTITDQLDLLTLCLTSNECCQVDNVANLWEAFEALHQLSNKNEIHLIYGRNGNPNILSVHRERYHFQDYLDLNYYHQQLAVGASTEYVSTPLSKENDYQDFATQIVEENGANTLLPIPLDQNQLANILNFMYSLNLIRFTR